MGAIALILVLAFLGGKYNRKFVTTGRKAAIISTIISLAAALYLILEDSFLREAAPLHWGILIVFFVGTIILSYLTYGSKKQKAKNLYTLILGLLTTLFVIAMLIDVVFGLPLSSAYNSSAYYGANYLLGFGEYALSTIAVSTAFTLLLLSAIATAMINIFCYLLSRDGRK